MYKHDPQHHNVLPRFMEGYQPYSTFVEEGFQPQQSFMFADFQIIHPCTNMTHNTIMFYQDLWRATSHIQHLLKRGFQPQQSFMFADFQIIHPCTNMTHNTIMFYQDLWRATSHIQHLLKRVSSLKSRSCLLIFKLFIRVQTWSTTP